MEKYQSIEHLNNFLANQITTDNFSYSFLDIYQGINRKLGPVKIKRTQAQTEREKNMIQRAEKYQQYKNKFYQDIDRDEF